MKKVLRQWIALHKRYRDEMRWDDKTHDVSYWYEERTQVGVFAAAIWSAGGIALEEYGDDKKKRARRKKSGHGRVDLYFCIGSREFIAEAKSHRLQATLGVSAVPLVSRIRASVKSAKEDVLCDREAGQRLGLVFIVPWVKAPKQGPLRLQAHIERLVEAAKRMNPEMVAWTFDRKPYRDGNEYWPGIIVIGNVPRRS